VHLNRIHGSLGPHESASQTATGSVQPFLQCSKTLRSIRCHLKMCWCVLDQQKRHNSRVDHTLGECPVYRWGSFVVLSAMDQCTVCETNDCTQRHTGHTILTHNTLSHNYNENIMANGAYYTYYIHSDTSYKRIAVNNSDTFASNAEGITCVMPYTSDRVTLWLLQF